MTTEMKAGSRFRSAVCDTEMVVVKAPAEAVDLRCGGHAVLPVGTDRPDGGEVEPGFDGGSLIGKRYVDDDATIEVLCTKPGAGSLSLGESPLMTKDAKPLPSSD